jgi:hypothetical protein
VYSPWAYVLLRLSAVPDSSGEGYRARLQRLNSVESLLGPRLFHAPGFIRPASMGDLAQSAVLLSNLAFLVIGSLWLGLRAHRRVLDYFTDSSVLLPLVAASGRSSFYASVWILTLLRVLAFLVASIPIVWFLLRQTLRNEVSELFYYSEPLMFIFWLTSIIISLSLAVLIGSIADLKHRHSVSSFIYRFVPFGLALIGGITWGLTFLSSDSTGFTTRTVMTLLPIVGTIPLLLAPIMPPSNYIVLINATLTLICLILISRFNTRWFVAHLDE